MYVVRFILHKKKSNALSKDGMLAPSPDRFPDRWKSQHECNFLQWILTSSPGAVEKPHWSFSERRGARRLSRFSPICFHRVIQRLVCNKILVAISHITGRRKSTVAEKQASHPFFCQVILCTFFSIYIQKRDGSIRQIKSHLLLAIIILNICANNSRRL